MTEIDQLASALFDRFRSFMASGLTQPLDLHGASPVSPRAGEQLRALNDWIDIYDGILDQRGYCHQTLRNRRSNLRHVRSLWGVNPLRAIKPRHISDALQQFLPERSAMARRIYDELRDVYREAVANEWCETNPVLNTRRPLCKVKRKRLSLETWDDMCEAALVHRQAWVLPMLLLALTTGQRRADLAKMRFSDVWDGHLHIEQQKKAGKGYGARVALPLTLRLDEIGLTLADVIAICRRYGPMGQTLLRRNDGKPIELSSLSTRFNEVIRGCCGTRAYGDHEWPSLHEVRSLAERLYRKQGIATQHLLGHKSQDMTDKYNDDRGLTAGEYKRLVA